jgi:hypothetical protein
MKEFEPYEKIGGQLYRLQKRLKIIGITILTIIIFVLIYVIYENI